MNEVIMLVIFIVMGFIGAYAHYFKKRYKDKTTKCTLSEYLKGNLPSTLYTVGAIIFAELGIVSVTSSIAATSILLALSAGYTADSVIDTAPDELKVSTDKAIDALTKSQS